MTKKQALKEAIRRWGKTAAVEENRSVKKEYEYMRCRVGKIDLGMFFMVQGHGKTFEEAFQDADKKKHLLTIE